MQQDDELLRVAATRLAGVERSQLGSHPTAARMHDYLEGTLDPATRSELQDHLSVCTACAQELLQLEEFLFSDVPETDLREASKHWPSARSRLVTEGLLSGTVSNRHPGSRIAWPVLRFPVTVNRALAGLSLALLMTTLYLSVQVRASRNPRVNIVIADLIPVTASPALRGNSSEDITIPAQAERVLLTLNVPPTDPYLSYVVEVRDGWEARAKLRWAKEIKVRAGSGNFNLDVDRNFFPEGAYLLRIWGISGIHREVLGEYHVRIVHKG